MSLMQPCKCDICGTTGMLGKGWIRLTDFAYVKHACPKCAAETDSYGGSHLHEARLSNKVRDALAQSAAEGSR